jgi:uncharacterized membrane protein
MTPPSSPTSPAARAPAADWWRSRWILPTVTVGLGGVILGAQATDHELESGLAWFAVFAVVAALQAFGGRSERARDRAGLGAEDERDALINTRAMASTGTVFVLLLTACIVFELVRGNDPSPYTYLMAAGGASYAVALLVLRRRS